MKSIKSYFSISVPLLKENLRRFWVIPFIFSLIYFMSGPFPYIISRYKDGMYYWIQLSLANNQPFFIIMMVLLPLLTALGLFRYLQVASSATVMHSMPFTRKKLFNTSFLSGLILVSIPIVFTALVYLIIHEPLSSQGLITAANVIDPNIIPPVDIFTVQNILMWLFRSLIITYVIFSIGAATSIFTGSSIIQAALSALFIFIIPALLAVIQVYFDRFLFGYIVNSTMTEFILNTSPLLGLIQLPSNLIPYYIWYFVSFVGLFALGSCFYEKRPIEKTTESLIFTPTKPILALLLAFLGMSVFGIFFEEIGKSMIYLYIGFAFGALITLMIVAMIIQKSFRIFTKANGIALLIYGLIATVFISCLNFDVTGFEKRVPATENIVTARFVNNFFYSDYFYAFNSREFSSNNIFTFKTPENINSMTLFHRDVLANAKEFERLTEEYRYGNSANAPFINSVNMEYTFNNKSISSRDYSIPVNFLRENVNLKNIFESKEYKDLILAGIPDVKNIISSNIDPNRYYYMQNDFKDLNQSSIINLNNTIISEFLTEYKKDLVNEKYEDMYKNNLLYGLDITFYQKNIESGKSIKNNSSYPIKMNYSNSINWLLKNYPHNFSDLKEDIAYMTVIKEDNYTNSGDKETITYANDKVALSSQDIMLYPDEELTLVPPVSNASRLVITDTAEIQELLPLLEISNTDREYYRVTVVYGKEDKNGELVPVARNYYINYPFVPEKINSYFK